MALDKEVKAFIDSYIDLIDAEKWQEFFDKASKELVVYKCGQLLNYLSDIVTIDELMSKMTKLTRWFVTNEAVRSCKNSTLYIPDNIVDVHQQFLSNGGLVGCTISMPAHIAEKTNSNNFETVIIRDGLKTLPHNFVQYWQHDVKSLYLPQSIEKIELGAIIPSDSNLTVYVPQSVKSLKMHPADIDRGIDKLIKRY